MGDVDVLDLTVKRLAHQQPSLLTSFTRDIHGDFRFSADPTQISALSDNIKWSTANSNDANLDSNRRTDNDADKKGRRRNSTCRSPSESSDPSDNDDEEAIDDGKTISRELDLDSSEIDKVPAESLSRRLETQYYAMEEPEKSSQVMPSVQRLLQTTQENGFQSLNTSSTGARLSGTVAAANASAASLPFSLNRLLALQQLYAGVQPPFGLGLRLPVSNSPQPYAPIALSPLFNGKVHAGLSPSSITPSSLNSIAAATGNCVTSVSPASSDYFHRTAKSETTPTIHRKRKRAPSDGSLCDVGNGSLERDSNSSDSIALRQPWPSESSLTPSSVQTNLRHYEQQSGTGYWADDVSKTASKFQRDANDESTLLARPTSSLSSSAPGSCDPSYVERRRKNNEAAKRSRDARRNKERETAARAAKLEQENVRLKAELAVLRTEAAKLQSLLFSRIGV